MSMDPYVLKIPPSLFNADESNYYPSKGVSIWSEEFDGLGRDIVGKQKSRISTWVYECLQHKIPDQKQRDKFSHSLWYSEKVFQVTRDDIELFKKMIEVNWRKSQMYKSRQDFYDGFADDYYFYIKVRLALRAGYVVVIQWV